MGGGESVLKDKKVVVVGGGYGGAQAVSLLRGKCLLTVIDAREYYHYCVGGPRATVEPGFEKKMLIPYAEASWEGIYRQGMVISIDPKEKVVHLDGGEEIPYDVVIIATGSKGPFPGKIKLDVRKMSEAEELFNEKQNQVKSANRITVIGAGAVGVETAAEVATEYPEKEVTLVSASDQIVTGPFKESFRKGAMKQLEQLGVNVILGERVSNFSDLPTDGSRSCTVKTEGGMEIESDLVMMSTGLRVNTEAFEKHFADSMDESTNCLKVNEFLQVEGHTDVFALGDCNNADQVKMAFKAEFQMKVIANNMVAQCKGGKMTPYKEKNVIMLTLGRYGGMTQYGSMVMGSLVTRIKSRDVFVGRTRKVILSG